MAMTVDRVAEEVVTGGPGGKGYGAPWPPWLCWVGWEQG